MDDIVTQDAAINMAAMLSERPHYFASTTIFLAPLILTQMLTQVRAIEDVIRHPKYVETVRERSPLLDATHRQFHTNGVFMGYDFHITEEGPRLIEINSNAGGAFIVDRIEQVVRGPSDNFLTQILDMFLTEWTASGRTSALKTIAIVDENPDTQYHFPDMCLAKTILERAGLTIVIADPSAFRLAEGRLYLGDDLIDLVYNRLTDFDLSDPSNAVIRAAYDTDAAVITPAPHHHALYADKRNLILLSDADYLAKIGATAEQIETLAAIPKTIAVTTGNATEMWAARKQLFFKPQAGFGSRGAFRGAKLTKKVWGEILEGGFIAQDLVAPPVRAVTVDGERRALKFDVRVYTYNGNAILYAARIYQGQTTNLRTAGGGLAAVIPTGAEFDCSPVLGSDSSASCP
ncbi:hypothetical protein GCM10009069_23700 [Algimonas arctica]|uniref:Circularly permuted type 2 ATP-grasp protein n=2 Tax=Algimonas arctica TaxID=1479486 RepID=A0A8J3CSE5_9PROT|nr:hypothetical protein GCM10009069_23700 [Algimonas arctica]